MTATLTPTEKRFSGCQARGAIMGVRVLRCFDGRNRPIYFLCQGTWIREYTALDDLESMLGRMEGKG